jgi:hypothetical protein
VIRSTAAAALALVLCGCSVLVGSATSRMARDLSSAVLNQPDPDTVREGLPAFLLLVDGLVEGSPDDVELLLAGARLYNAYATGFVPDASRAARLTERALGYGRRAVCAADRALCRALDEPLDPFAAALAGSRDASLLYGFGSAWAGWVQAHASNWSAIADLPKIRALMERVVVIAEEHDGGGAHAYLGVLATQLPASLGGQPELGRRHFERALAISRGRNLMVKVLYARSYARLVFDRPLHDRLLTEVLEAEPAAPGYTLSNTLARRQARDLLADAEEYF